MEIYTIYIATASSLFFIATGVYLHFLRKRAERIIPDPFLNPKWKRKQRKIKK